MDLKQDSDQTHDVDVHVGRMIRMRRHHLDCSQADLARACGVSFQQIQKYERAANRVSASMLVKVARKLECRPSDFLPQDVERAESARIDLGLATLPGGLEVAAAYVALSPARRRAALDFLRALADC